MKFYLQKIINEYIIVYMNAWQISNKKQINKVNITENLEQVDDLKVKITKCFITKKDVNLYAGNVEDVEYPIIPGYIAVGQISEVLNKSIYFEKGAKVYLSYNENANNSGFLKDFAVISKKNCHILPQSVTEYEALFVNHLSIALSVIDALRINKGEYVAVVGGSILGNLIAQLLSYYKAVPILVDDNDYNLEISKKTDIYYSIKADRLVTKEVIDITGGRKCKKVIYITDNDISFETALSFASEKATVAVTGIMNPAQKFNLNSAFKKDLIVKFITEGEENISASINLLVQKAVNLNYFELKDYKFDYINKQFENAYENLEVNNNKTEFTVNLL